MVYVYEYIVRSCDDTRQNQSRREPDVCVTGLYAQYIISKNYKSTRDVHWSRKLRNTKHLHSYAILANRRVIGSMTQCS